jgi:hypothetical protein
MLHSSFLRLSGPNGDVFSVSRLLTTHSKREVSEGKVGLSSIRSQTAGVHRCRLILKFEPQEV